MPPTSIVFVNRCYWPDTEATGQLLTDLCEHLVTQGHDVSVVCGQPNSPQSGAEYQRSGIQVHNGVHVHRLNHFALPKRVPAARLLNLISFTRATKTYLKQSRLAADVFVSETDPFLLPPVVAHHAKSTGARFVAYLQDIYPDVAEAIGKARPGMVTRRIRASLRSAYQSADRVIVLASCMKERLTSPPWSLDSLKITIVPNWADCEAIRPTPHDMNELKHGWLRDRPQLQNKFIVMHSGNMGLTQRLDVVIDATQDPAWPDNAILLLVGDGAARQRLQEQAAQAPNDRVAFLPYQPRHRLAESLSAADLHLVSMHENITGCLCPSKLYGILAAGRPVLAIAPPETDLVQTVQTDNLGWVARPGNAHEVACMVKAATLSDPQSQSSLSRRLAETRYDRPVVLNQLAQALTTTSNSHFV